jgi:hypothetical protein
VNWQNAGPAVPGGDVFSIVAGRAAANLDAGLRQAQGEHCGRRKFPPVWLSGRGPRPWGELFRDRFQRSPFLVRVGDVASGAVDNRAALSSMQEQARNNEPIIARAAAAH